MFKILILYKYLSHFGCYLVFIYFFFLFSDRVKKRSSIRFIIFIFSAVSSTTKRGKKYSRERNSMWENIERRRETRSGLWGKPRTEVTTTYPVRHVSLLSFEFVGKISLYTTYNIKKDFHITEYYTEINRHRHGGTVLFNCFATSYYVED